MRNGRLLVSVRFIDAAVGKRGVPREGTYPDEVVLTSLPEEWVRDFPPNRFGNQPFDMTALEAPHSADLRAVHEHLDLCPAVLRIGPVTSVLGSPPMADSHFHLENSFRAPVAERSRAPAKMLVAGESGLRFDVYPQPVGHLAAMGLSFVERNDQSFWRVEEESLEGLSPYRSIEVGPWQGLVYPSNLLLARVRHHDPHLVVQGYLRGLHPSPQEPETS